MLSVEGVLERKLTRCSPVDDTAYECTLQYANLYGATIHKHGTKRLRVTLYMLNKILHTMAVPDKLRDPQQMPV
jgi:hypothetical protein